MNPIKKNVTYKNLIFSIICRIWTMTLTFDLEFGNVAWVAEKGVVMVGDRLMQAPHVGEVVMKGKSGGVCAVH